jgi:hypothetical protein
VNEVVRTLACAEDTAVRTAFILGAGCSYGTLRLCKCSFPPLARDFGSELKKRCNWETEYPELARVAEHLGTTLPEVGLEDIWTCIDYHAKFPQAFNTEWGQSGNVVLELKSALLRLYGQTCDAVASRLELSNEYTLGEIVNQMKPGDTLISFNYDTLVENLFRKRRGSSPQLRHCHGVPPDGVVRFVKPHGSASWDLHDLDHVPTDGPPALQSLHEDDAKSGRTDPLMLGAVPIKSELILEVQCCFRVPEVYRVIRDQWRAVADAVRDADRLVVLGYSFPKEDTYGRFFYREAMRERRTRPPLSVEYYETRERRAQTAAAIFEAFPGKLRVRYRGKVKPAPRSAFRGRLVFVRCPTLATPAAPE